MSARPALLLAVALCGPLPTAVAQFQPLPPEQLKRIKGATVFVKVQSGNRQGSGSGFLVRIDGSSGFVATNDHVVAGPRTILGRLPTAVQLVFNSGTKEEWITPGEVVGRDSERDLALVRFRVTRTPMPPPLSLEAPDKLSETMPVYVCGFPFGEMLAAGDKHPEISIGQASVSSIRSNERGEVVTVQLNGALNPGNSGGPVVSADGKLVGVAVRTLKAAGIGEAVPGPMVGDMLKGRVGGVRLIQTREWASVRQAGLVGQVADPFRKVRSVRGFVAPVLGQANPPLDVGAVPGAIKLPLRMADPSEMLVFSQVQLPAARQVWVQVEWSDADGRTRRSPAEKVDMKTPAQIAEEEEKIAAILRQLFEGGGAPPSGEDEPDAPPSGSPPAGRPPSVRPPGMPRRSPDDGHPAVVGSNGQVLPPLAVRLPPGGHAERLANVLTELENYTAEGAKVELLVQAGPRADADGHGDGPSLPVLDPATGRPLTDLDFVLDVAQARRFNALQLRSPVVVQVIGQMQRGAERRPWSVVVVRTLRLVDVNGRMWEPSDRASPDPPAGGSPGEGVYRAAEPVPDQQAVVAAPDRWRERSGRLTGVLEVISKAVSADGRSIHQYRFQGSGAGGVRFTPSVGLNGTVYNAMQRLSAKNNQMPSAEVVFRTAPHTGRTVGCMVSHIRLLGPDGTPVWEGTDPDAPRSPAAPPAATPNPPPVAKPAAQPDAKPAQPAGAPTPQPAAPPAATGLPTGLLVLVGVLLVGGALGTGLLVVLLVQKQAKPAGKKRPKSRPKARDAWDDDDEDDDPPPRKPARRR